MPAGATLPLALALALATDPWPCREDATYVDPTLAARPWREVALTFYALQHLYSRVRISDISQPQVQLARPAGRAGQPALLEASCAPFYGLAACCQLVLRAGDAAHGRLGPAGAVGGRSGMQSMCVLCWWAACLPVLSSADSPPALLLRRCWCAAGRSSSLRAPNTSLSRWGGGGASRSIIREAVAAQVEHSRGIFLLRALRLPELNSCLARCGRRAAGQGPRWAAGAAGERVHADHHPPAAGSAHRAGRRGQGRLGGLGPGMYNGTA